MSEPPDKIKHIDIIRIEYGRKKLCQCQYPHYEIDTANRLVLCTKCGAVVDPFEALRKLARYYEQINQRIDAALDHARELERYQPRRRVLKDLEQRMGRGDNTMIPTCPHCHEPFELEELLATTWCNKRYIERLK